MPLLTGLTPDGLEVPVQVKPDGKLVAEGLTGPAGPQGPQGPAGPVAGASGQLAGLRNVLINGAMVINQRGVTIAAAAPGAYGPDRWKKVDAGNMTQIVEAGSFEPGATYTLSGTGVTTQQLTAPATGNWTLPNIPIAATKIQLEPGPVATPFERKPFAMEVSLCQRYYEMVGASVIADASLANQSIGYGIRFLVQKRAAPSLTEVNMTYTVNVGAVSLDTIQTQDFRYRCTVLGPGAVVRSANVIADAEL